MNIDVKFIDTDSSVIKSMSLSVIPRVGEHIQINYELYEVVRVVHVIGIYVNTVDIYLGCM